MANQRNRYNAKRNYRRHLYKKKFGGKKTGSGTTATADTLSLDTDESTSTAAEANIQGSRIINIDQLKKYSDELSRHSMHCSGSIVLNGEFRDGLASIIIAQCSICKHTIRLETSNKVKGPKGYRRYMYTVTMCHQILSIDGSVI